MGAQIHGTVEPGFEAVRSEFEENFRKRGEYGAAVTVWHQGKRVVDLWGGEATIKPSRPWTADTLMVMFSATKGMAALAFLVLEDRGKIDLDRTVASYWPEFGANGKEAITVRQCLNHRSGLVGIEKLLSLDELGDDAAMSRAIEAQRPVWAPGTRQGYHATSYGMLAQQIFKRVAGESLGSFLQREVFGPLGADVFLGLPESEHRRVATLYPLSLRERITKVLPRVVASPKVEGRMYRSFIQKDSDTRRAFANPPELGLRGVHNFNSPKVWGLELPWANGLASARGLGKVYAALSCGGILDGKRIVSEAAVKRLGPRQTWELDRVLRKPMGWSQGFLKEDTRLFSPNTSSFGHPGAGGSVGWCDPDAQVAVGYVMNHMDVHLRSPRSVALCQAVYRALRWG